MEALVTELSKCGDFYKRACFQLWPLSLLTTTHLHDVTLNSDISGSAWTSFLNCIQALTGCRTSLLGRPSNMKSKSKLNSPSSHLKFLLLTYFLSGFPLVSQI